MPPKKQDRTKITWADSLAVALTFVWIPPPETIDAAAHGTITTRLSPAVDGDLRFSELGPTAQGMFA
ncbi:hypothetical protein [Corynebacterium appendicis]|uniref:hypothetical protein n=1 Tax=Corynebacterium appendicis TaxID=163202 RepID=UPI0023577918|nr:hypothetical protein [Corynebacterium appendicis]